MTIIPGKRLEPQSPFENQG